MASKHGTRTRYRSGCRCDLCTWAETNYRADLRMRKNSGGTVRPNRLADVPAPKPSKPGPVETATVAEVARYVETRPALAAACVALAAVLDSPAQTAKPSAARVLATILNELAKGASRPPGKLSVVRGMTRKSDGA
jgi:hypothetical protein